MKLTLKLILVVCLFSSVTFADGDMPGGGYTDGDMPGGGKTCTSNCFVSDQQTEPVFKTRNETQTDETFFSYIQRYLFSMLG